MQRLLTSLFLLFTSQSFAFEVDRNTEIKGLFDSAGVQGTFVLYDVSADRLTVHNMPRAEERFIPASTFKVPNSLIGLSTGVIETVDDVLPYGGKPQPFKVWEQDMSLRDAIKVSNVPVYQELARRIGPERMHHILLTIPYGYAAVGSEVDTFWLKGPLQISAIEQAQFLARLAQGRLPFSDEVQQSVREIVRLEQASDKVLYGKTGWTTTPDPDIGWWVGWVEKNDQVFSFALNIDMPEKTDVAKRMTLGKACLEALGVY